LLSGDTLNAQILYRYEYTRVLVYMLRFTGHVRSRDISSNQLLDVGEHEQKEKEDEPFMNGPTRHRAPGKIFVRFHHRTDYLGSD
jgi:hypothetical protein